MMDKQALIDMLNADLRDEHASVIRYLIHAYQVGEDTPLGAMLLPMAREEMWHTDWLADVIGELGAEPDMTPGVYPHDPTSNGSLLRSYIEWEERLVKLYAEQAEGVSDPEIKRVLLQQSRESNIHKQRFAATLAKLGAAAEEPFAYGDPAKFSPEMAGRLQGEMTDEYKLVLQHLRHAFVLGADCPVSSKLELAAMRHMKHLSHFAESLAEAAHEPKFDPPPLDMSRTVEPALQSDLQLTHTARDRFTHLSQEAELTEHPGLKLEVENMIIQEEFLAATIHELQESEPAPPAGQLTVGSLMDAQ